MKDLFVGQLGAYIQLADTVDWTDLNEEEGGFKAKQARLVEFWKSHRLNLKNWFAFAMICYLHQPSSAAAERVFSILKRVLESDDYQALDDIVLAVVYTNYRTR